MRSFVQFADFLKGIMIIMDNRLIHTPEGVRDIYGEEYARKLSLQATLSDTIKGYGYSDIQTPSFEFFDVFSKEIGTNPSKELYKFFDKENNTLVLRADFTPGVARSASKYFLEEKQPIRLTYLGNVFNNTSDHQGKLKEFTEIGAECIGEPSVAADAEMIALTVNCLKNTGLEDFQVSIGHVGYFKGICQSAGINEETELSLREQISGKNVFAVEEILRGLDVSDEIKTQISAVTDSFGDIEALKLAKNNVSNDMSIDAINRLIDLYDLLRLYGVDKYVSFDLGMLSKYYYYTGIIFRAFTYGVGESVAKGGRYDSLLEKFGKKSAATGVCFVVDQLMIALSRQHIRTEIKDKKAILVYDKDSLHEAITFAGQYREKGGRIELIPYDDTVSDIKAYLTFNSENLVDEIYRATNGAVKAIVYKEQ